MNLLFFILGLLVGWNLIPQPVWVKSLIDKAVNWIQNRLDI